jgi:uncharacterized protein (DUF885 family)
MVNRERCRGIIAASLVSVSLILSGCGGPAARKQPIDAFFKETFELILRNDPEFATSVGRHEYDNRWTDWSKAGLDTRRQFFAQRLSQLNSFPASSLSAENRLTQRLVEYDFRSRLDAWKLDTELLCVSQLFGSHNRVYLVVDRMPAHTVHDYENIIARLRAVPAYVDQNIALMDEAISNNITQPRVVVDLVARQITAQMNQDVQQTELLKAFRAFPSNISAADQERLRQEAITAYEQQFLPSWHKLHDYMLNTYSKHVRPADSLNSMPGGASDYHILVQRMTTTTMTPDEIHSVGEKEVKRIEGEMRGVIAEAGYSGSIEEFQKKLDADPAQHFRSKEEMLAYCRKS